MIDLRITWNDRKAEANTADEDRFLLLGASSRERLLIVCHCHHESSATIRIISARKASRSERRQYAERSRR